MEITLNGNPLTLAQSCSVAELIRQLQAEGRIAVEVNRKIIPHSEFENHILVDGDQVEIVHAIGGG